MPKKTKNNDENPERNDEQDRGSESLGKGIIKAGISSEMREAYLDYAMSVITARALPDVRDGLKPVQRRLLYVMYELGLTAGGKFRKCAKICGDTSGNYHPHGESNVYGALVNMAQDFSMRYPMVTPQGNVGSIDGDSPAAMRYTEARMSKLSAEMLRDIEKETVDFRDNYDGTNKEPIVLPAGFPNLLANGTLGIAVGMATNIPPHNLREISDAAMHLVDDPKATTEDLLEYVKGPDFPTGGIAFNQNDIHHAYANGRGGVVTRGVANIEELKSGTHRIIITEIPYRVNKATMVMNIADLVRDKKLEGIKDLRDESTRDIRVVIELKGNTHPQKVLNYLYKHTELEVTFHYNLVALVDGVPQTLSLKAMLEAFIGFRRVVVKRRTEHDLRKAEDREHILIGLTKALDHIDEIIKLIKKSKDTPEAHKNLMQKFKFSDRQATAILEMRLQKLAGLERKKLEDELKEIQALIKELKSILASEKKMMGIVKKEIKDVSDKYGDDRRTKIMKQGTKSFTIEDLVPDEENTLVLTESGYVKRTSPSEYKRQKRGGIGVVDLNTKDEDFVTKFLTASTHSDILFFTDKGKAYQVKMYDLPEGKRATRGKSIMNYIALASDEKVTSILPLPKKIKEQENLSLILVTKHGTAKKVKASSFRDVRANGLIAMKLASGDELISVSFVDKDDDVLVVTEGGQAIRSKESDVREMGRTAAGVRIMRLGKGDSIVSAQVIKKDLAKDTRIVLLSENGYGKKVKAGEFKVQKRGGSGVKAVNITQKTGNLIAMRAVTDQEELMAISKKSQVIRCDINEIPMLSRTAQGVRIMKLRAEDKVVSIICL